MRGELALDSLTCRDRQFTQVLGPFWIDDQVAMFGSWVAWHDNQTCRGARRPTPLRPVTAKVFGGALDGDGWMSFGSQPRYNVRANLVNADLATRRELAGNNRNLRGRIDGDVVLQGFGHNRTALGGHGNLHLHDADIYELPVMISMLKILSIKAPDPNAFSQSDINFHIEGEHVYFDKLDFKGDAISLLGKGEMNFQGDTHMVLAATVGHADAGLPALRNFFSRSKSTIHADSRQRQLAGSGYPQGSLSRREPGIEGFGLHLQNRDVAQPSRRRTDEHRTSFQYRRQRGGNFPGSDPGFRNRPCPAGEHRAGDFSPAARQKAETAAGIGQADGDNHETAERDADGRRIVGVSRPSGEKDAGHEESPRLPCPGPHRPERQHARFERVITGRRIKRKSEYQICQHPIARLPLPQVPPQSRIAHMHFTKMQGAGNDYMYVDCFSEPIPQQPDVLARKISDRHFGVGSDGLILICQSQQADARMRMFNADGSESEMCGNGIRCVAKYVYDYGICRNETLRIETGRGILTLKLEVAGGRVQRVRRRYGRADPGSGTHPRLRCRAGTRGFPV